MKTFKLGTGSLTWDGRERRSDRYGFVTLYPNEVTSQSNGPPTRSLVDVPVDAIGRHGELIATVVRTRTSTHIGDLFHNFKPSTPEVGERILLGEGLLVVQQNEWGGGHDVGLIPLDDRDYFWLVPRALYRCHEQTVELRFKEKARPKKPPKPPYRARNYGNAIVAIPCEDDVQVKR